MGAVSNVVNAGLGMVTGGLAGPLVNRVGQGMWGAKSGGGVAPASRATPQVTQRAMPAAYNNPYIQQFIAQQRAGGVGQGGMPFGMNVVPLAMRMQVQQPQTSQPTWDVNSYNPYQNMLMQKQTNPQPTPYQNMGMFGAYNPFMPRR